LKLNPVGVNVHDVVFRTIIAFTEQVALSGSFILIRPADVDVWETVEVPQDSVIVAGDWRRKTAQR